MSHLSISIIGAGAIGSALAARLATSGADVTLVARGERLAEIAGNGILLRDLDGDHHARPKVTDRLTAPVSCLFVAVKGPAIHAALTENIAGLGPDTRVIPLVNGIPWWFFDDLGHAVEAVDPGGRLLDLVPFDQIVGAVTLMTASFDGNAVVSTIPHKLALGPTTPNGPRPVDLADALSAAGIALDRSDHIRPIVWEKLAINLSTNPLSALTGRTLGQIAADPATRTRAVTIAAETEALAAAWGAEISIADRLPAMMEGAGAFRTSMLQDAQAGRPLELAPIADAPLELAAARDVPMPETTALIQELRAQLAAA